MNCLSRLVILAAALAVIVANVPYVMADGRSEINCTIVFGHHILVQTPVILDHSAYIYNIDIQKYIILLFVSNCY